MKPGIIIVLGGAAALAGCSAQSTGHPATPQPTHRSGPVALAPTADPRPAPHTKPTKSTPPGSRPTSGGQQGTTQVTGNAFQKGQAYLKAHHYALASAAFRAAIARHQEVAASYNGLGLAALATGNSKTAYSAFSHAASLQPKDASYLAEAATAAVYAKSYHAAYSYASRYIALRPSDGQGYHMRTLADGGLILPKQQMKDARMVFKLDPRDPEAYEDMGIALTNNSKYSQATFYFTRAIQMRPKRGSYYINRAIAENLGKQPQLALDDLQRARALTTNPNARANIDLAIRTLKSRMQQQP